MATTTLLGHAVTYLHKFSQNVEYDRISLENGKELVMTPEIDNKYREVEAFLYEVEK